MNDEIEAVKQQIRRNKKQRKKQPQKSKYFVKITKLLLTIILTLTILIGIRTSKTFKQQFYIHVYEKNFSFASINRIYKKYFGEPIPFFDVLNPTIEPVFSEKLTYDKKESYKDGVKLMVEKGYLVPSLESGMVIYVGEKQGYGNTVVIQQTNGIDVWYGNLKNVSIKLYDYIEKGSLVGEVEEDKLYLVYKKDGKVLNAEEQLQH